MSAGHHGAGTPEGDDPFGYLYRPENGASGAAPAPPSGYDRVRPVGERGYGGGRGGYGYPPQQNGYAGHQAPGQPSPHYAAPETTGYGAPPPGPPGGGHGRGDSRRNGLLIGAIAVVTAVVLGVGAAIVFSGDDGNAGDDLAGVGTPQSVGAGDEGDEEPEPEPEPEDEDEDDEEEEDEEPVELPEADLGTLQLSNGAGLAGDIPNARSGDGSYIAGLNRVGATITWTFDFRGEAGSYDLWVGYSVPNGDQKMSFAINSTSQIRDDLHLRDFVKQGAWEKNWTRTYNYIDLKEGENTIYIGCDNGDSCDAVIDRILVTERGHKPDW
ncbi:carbohydrate-binding protein [Streptomyces alkaliphilus]|uniref:carbohydrate-binding protein n=1 Tax=Streptomyces alkaliphilus TaxID=1472722 RepID=UPI001297793C|nr:carbohydrate-binding protein [Streptomyces alkaliphilus]